jgi:hypothetical protein
LLENSVQHSGDLQQRKPGKGVSIFTFAGFSLLQITGMLHGVFQQDWYLFTGMAASFVACNTVVVLSIIFRKGETSGTASTFNDERKIMADET